MTYSHTNTLGETHYLHSQQILIGGSPETIFYFDKKLRPEAAVDLPPGREVTQNPRNGFIGLRMIRPDTGWHEEEAMLLTGLPGTAVPLALELADETLQLSLLGQESDLIRAPDGSVFEALPRFFACVATLERCITRLERLVNSETTLEADLQEALEECPELLKVFGHHDAVPQVVLETDAGDLIPDFVLKSADHDLCDILELKRPDLPLVVGTENRPRPSARLAKALSQMRDYAEVLDTPAVRDRVEERYGLCFFRPRLYLIAGRSPRMTRSALLRAIADYRTDVYTWDDFIARARARFG